MRELNRQQLPTTRRETTCTDVGNVDIVLLHVAYQGDAYVQDVR